MQRQNQELQNSVRYLEGLLDAADEQKREAARADNLNALVAAIRQELQVKTSELEKT